MLPKYYSALISLVLACTAQRLAADAISIDESRPLAQLIVELVQRYRYLVSYEEAPYDVGLLRTEVRPNGLQYRYPSWTPVVFHLPDGPTAGVTSQLGPAALDSILKEYSAAGNSGKFKIIFEGEYAHIVPAARVVGGRLEEFQPVLSARIPFPAETRSCNDALRELFFRIKVVRGVTVLGGTTPIGALLRHQCTVVGDDLTGRDILSQILDQAGASFVPGLPRNRFSWELMYDANWDAYFLSTLLVPEP